jgi:hypothetical protein
MPIDFRASQIQTNKIIASGSTGTETGAQIVVYSHLADDGTSPNQGFIDQSAFITSSIGTDIFLYVSGGIGEKNISGAKSISVFGGDVHISGNLSIDGTGGGGGGSGTSFYRLELLDYAAINSTSSITVGQVIFPANQFTGSLVLHGVIANQLSTATGSIQLYNVSSGSYVEIGGAGITHLFSSGNVPAIITSVDLISATNFNSSSEAIYELQVSSSNGASYGFFGGFELRPSGSFTGISYITSSFVYVSGTWEDGGNKLATTSSVALAGNLGTGYFSDNVGSDVYFFVSGNNGGVAAGDGVAVFGGDVVMSGTLFGGSPLKIGTRININGASNGDNSGNTIEFDNSSSIGGRIQTANNTVGAISQGNLGLTLNAGNDNVAGPGGNLEINGGAGADSVIGNGWYSGDVIINGRVGGSGLSDGVSLYYGGTGGNINAYSGPGGNGGDGGDAGVINLNGGQGGNGSDAASSGGNGGGISLYAGNGGLGTDIGGLGGDVSIYAGTGEGGIFTPNISGSKGGNIYLSPGLGGISNGAPAGNGGDLTIGAGPAGLDLATYPATYEFTGSGRMYILGGTNGKDRVHLSGSELTIGSDFNTSQPTYTQKFKRVFINRAADEERAANSGEPAPSAIPDVFFYVSGGVGQKDGTVPAIALFDGDVHISGNLTVDGTYPSGGGGGSSTLQQAYDAGLPSIAVNNASGSFVISGGLNPVGFNFPPLIRLEPGKNGPYATNFSALDIYGYSGGSSASLVNIGTANSVGGGAQFTLRSTAASPSKLSWFSGAGELYGSTGTANIYYHPNDSSLYFDVAGSGQKYVMKDGSGESGTANVAEFINAAGAFGGTIKFFTGANASNASVINSGSLEQVRVAKFYSGLSGSLTRLTDGTSYIIAGTGIGVSSASNGAITISAAGGSGLATGKQYIASATTTTTTTPLMIGQFSWVPSDYTGLTSVKVRAIMSTDGTANHTGSLQIYNLTSGSYIDLVDTPATSAYFDITSSIPTLVTSSNLLNGITNFDNSSICVYEVRVSGSAANNTIIGGVELIFS